ncbi:hypothetical protein [Neisseria iguanae]|uniref:Uncharacterized protein n=1 Tax=Neisseria iguanae TaxID=90242 RepID=A0A2P7TWX6_9NEIS|nr:hypothetical protein [Neisseria iguanae]PSJ79229.1 hypothetical protein C7N83_13495 [Neisseria iguanae]
MANLPRLTAALHAFRLRGAPIPTLCTGNPSIQINPDEVAEVFYVPFDFAMNLKYYKMRELQYQGKAIAMPTLYFPHYKI